ncbi:LOW QUALITY PROTEIN: regulator of G-protein signaling 18 [Gouania willdenowi]|uniref:LOW QUALITY PROTEIN: regulator of G-protein signaling 18 n=1 Tax=Gouania willdenowi TaxID=441366 RepID=UPI0010546935|nr:LOW QUALITY PROTEIN: regulator of G-protein signaling 18-like [Gouania willdenowi]
MGSTIFRTICGLVVTPPDTDSSACTETLLFLFPQFNYMAPKEEARFKVPGSEDEQTPTMKDDCSRQKDKERKSRLSLFLTKSGSHENVSPHKKTNLATSNISPEVALQWSESFEKLLKHSDGVETFSQFLRTEFSEENIEFWLACEEYKTIDSETKLLSKAKCIYTVFIESEAPKEVNIDYDTRMAIQKNITQPTAHCFEAAQLKVYSLMKKDSYPRFLLSDIYLRLTRKRGSGATLFRRRSRSCVFNERGEATSEPSAW